MDGHEFTFYGVTKDGYMKNADDMQSTPASSLNNDPLVNQLAEEAVDGLHKNAVDSGLRIYHYGTTVNNPIGRAYYGLYNSISILVETRGIGAYSTNFARRVYSQQNAAHSIIDYAVAMMTPSIRLWPTPAQVTADGKVFDAEDTVILQQVASGKNPVPHRSDHLSGTAWTAAMSNPPPLPCP